MKAIMLAAGVFNLIAFVAVTRALQIATLVYVNALNASQVAMAGLAGVIFFHLIYLTGAKPGARIAIFRIALGHAQFLVRNLEMTGLVL